MSVISSRRKSCQSLSEVLPYQTGGGSNPCTGPARVWHAIKFHHFYILLGFKFPMQRFFKEVFTVMRVAPTQCTPNVLKEIMCFENLGLFVELDCGLQEFLYFFKMRWLLSPLRLEEGGLPFVDNIMWWKRNAHALRDDDVVIEVSSIEDSGKRNETEVSSHPD
ncbi:unnamed protein product [Prunus brigantina]